MAKKKDIFEDLILPTDAEIKEETKRKRISQSMKGKTLDELVGHEKAKELRKVRTKNSTGPRPKEVMQRIAATRRLNGSYGNSMLGKEHKESTKILQAQKAQIRQDLKKKLGLGKNDCVPKDLLLKAYKKNKL